MENKHGLSRSIPAEVKRTVRQNSGFGCVICGLGIYEYEHINPEFNDAKEHNPNGITLLCHQCHGKKTRGQISSKTVLEHMTNPKCKQSGYTHEFFDIATKLPSFKIGESIYNNTETLLEINGDKIIYFDLPENEGEPLKLNAKFHNNEDELVLSILDNEWIALDDNWDIDIVGRKLTIREGLGKFVLEIINDPDGYFEINKIDMLYSNVQLKSDAKGLTVSFNDKKRLFIGKAGIANNFAAAIVIEGNSFIYGKGKPGKGISMSYDELVFGPTNKF